MSFDEFLEAAKNHVQDTLPDAEVRIQQIDKLQGESYLGISVRPEGTLAAVCFNVNPAYERYQEDQSKVESIFDRIASDAMQIASTIPAFDLTDITDYETAKDNLVMQVIPAEPNKELLESIPHKTVEDIAVVYRIELPDTVDGPATTLVTNHLLDEYKISPEQLHLDAVAAQEANHPAVLRNLSEVMAEMMGGMMDLPESRMWVATVEGGVNGASVIQIPEFLDEAAEKLGGDFFVLPSSVHEVLLISDDGSFDREGLENMVQGINATEVREIDYLSDSIYHYDSENQIFEKAATFESRMAGDPELDGEEHGRETMSVLLVEPDRYPRPVEIGTGLEDLQNAVGGYIEVVYPFEEPVGLIVNEEGKLDGLPLNRALRDEDGEIYDVIAGSFLVVGLTEDNFGSLTPEQMSAFEEKFRSPEVFVRMGRGIMAIPVEEKAVEESGPELKPQRQAREDVR